MLKISMVFLFLLFLIISCSEKGNSGVNNSGESEFSGDYLGMELPGNTPVVFAPGLFNEIEEQHTSPAFNPDGREIYFGHESQIYGMILTGDNWSSRQVLPLIEGDFYAQDPVISPTGQTLIFFSNCPSQSGASSRERLWVTDNAGKNGTIWANSNAITGDFENLHPHWGASLAANNNLYFGAGINEDALTDIYASSYQNGEFQSPEKLGPEVNGESTHEDAPYIAPDESYLLFTRTTSNWMQKNIYVSSKDSTTGAWQPAVKLPYPINTGAHELSPKISPDGKYFFFLSERSGRLMPYWVSVQAIENYLK